MGVKRGLDEDDELGNVNKITEDEAALYDRQIRLWGMECQKRLREARILIIGLNGVGAEVVKNLTLSGMNSITILDDTEVTESDKTAQFFVASSELGEKRSEASLAAIQELNPNVKILVETGDPNTKPDSFFADFDAIFATGCDIDLLIKIDKICRDTKEVQFYCADTWGFYGYCFLDLLHHNFKNYVKTTEPESNEKPSTSTDSQKMVEQKLDYYPLGRCMLAKVGEGLKKRINKVFVLLHVVNHFRELKGRYPAAETHEKDYEQLKKIRTAVSKTMGVDVNKISDDMLNFVFGELSPVCAAVGGVLANEMIKGLSKKGLPIHNFFLFDGFESVGVNEVVKTSLDDL